MDLLRGLSGAAWSTGAAVGGTVAGAATTAAGGASLGWALVIGAAGALGADAVFDEDSVDGVGVDDWGARWEKDSAMPSMVSLEPTARRGEAVWLQGERCGRVGRRRVERCRYVDAAGVEVEGFDGAFDVDDFAVIG